MAVRRAVVYASAPIRARPQTIRSGAARGLRINVAGSRLGYILGTAEADTQEFMTRQLAPGDVFYDLGANVGFLSLVASVLVGRSGAVHAFEPLPENAAAARANAEMNGLEQMTVIQAAAGDSTRTANFARGTSDQNGHIVSMDDEGIDVQVLALDHFVKMNRARIPNVIKIDVEGHELAAIEGMREILRDHRPTVLCEMHTTSPSLQTHPVALSLRDVGYDLGWLEPITGPVGHWASHLVATPRMPYSTEPSTR